MLDATTSHDAGREIHDEGVALVQAAEDGRDWQPIIEWLARHPDQVNALAGYLATGRGVKAALASRAGQPSIAGYQFIRVIGRGTFGVVHRAYDTVLKRDVAVKVVEAFGEADRARFRFEAEAIAGLNHQNVVTVYASGEADGKPYLVMPLMPGGSLATWLHEKGPDRLLPPKKAAEIVCEIALGTHHAHQRGLIHRDLKPGNVLLDEEERPLIADFGLARRMDASVSCAAGTLAYMAPEQARGDKRLTTAVDVYALGVILFELLAGKTPFGGDDGDSIMRRIQEEPVPDLCSLRADVPRDLEDVCLRCLEKDPQRRYPSALDLANDLTAYLNDESPPGRREGWFSWVLRAIRHRRQTDSMGSWHALLWGAASVVLAMAGLQTAVALSSPGLGWAAVAYYLLAWMAMLWVFSFVSWDRLNLVEKSSTLVQLGMLFGCAACLPVSTWPDGDVVRALPAFLAVKALGIFVHGQWYWGRLYLVGLLFFALAALMPFIPSAVWPVTFGLCSGSFQLWAALHLRRVHRAAASAR